MQEFEPEPGPLAGPMDLMLDDFQLAFVNKAGWLLKRGKLKRKWVKRWFSVNSHKGSFKYCNSPGAVCSLLRKSSRPAGACNTIINIPARLSPSLAARG